MYIYIYKYINTYIYIYSSVTTPPFLRGGGVSKRKSGNMVQDRSLYKGGLALFLFVIFIFRNYFTLSKIVLCI